MASSPAVRGWICQGEVSIWSNCVHRSLVDATNLFFLCIFWLSWLVVRAQKQSSSGRIKKGLVVWFVSVCCALASLSYFCVAVWSFVAKTDASRKSSWFVLLVRAAIWLSLMVSAIVDKQGWVKNLVMVWWVTFCLMVSAVNIRALIVALDVGVLDIGTWPINFALIFCSFYGRRIVPSETPEESLHEPLLTEKPKKGHVSEISTSSLFGRAVFSWVNPLLHLGHSKTLQLEDIPSLVSEDEASLAYKKFFRAWESLVREKGSHTKENLVFRAIMQVYFKENMLVAFGAFLRVVAVALSPLLLYWFVQFSNSTEENLSEGLMIVGMLVVVKLVESFSQRHWFFSSRCSGMRIRSALMVAVYQKQLKLSNIGRRHHSSGEILNYIAVDAYRMGEFLWWLHTMWSLLLQFFLAIGVLFSVIGTGALPGLVPLLVFGVLNLPFANILQVCQTKLMVSQDKRLRSTSEILNNMKIIKLQSWEKKFKGLIETQRKEEMKWLSKALLMKPYATVLYWISPTVISSVVFIGCVLLGSASLNASTIFTILASLRSMSEPVRVIPDALSILIQIKVSFDRINAFMLDDELTNETVRTISSSTKSIEVVSGNFAWDAEPASLTLKDINLEAEQGQKIAVCGPVGAGKSSLLCALLGEISQISGTVKMLGSIAYVSQTSWIQSGTIKDNILFGKVMDEAAYEKAIRACALDKDINSFEHGDLTEIGQRGLNMSGGQKQRIQLARAVYSDADIYLLDDPFSAVDAQTAAVLFRDCVMAALAKKTVVLVTHQVEFLSEVNQIVVMQDGRIMRSGTYCELLKAEAAFEKLVNAHKDAITTIGPVEVDALSREDSCEQSDTIKENGAKEKSEKALSGMQLTQEEEKEFGDFGWRPYRDYFVISKGTILITLSNLSQSAFVVLQASASYWLALAIQFPGISASMLIGTYTGISFLSVVFVYLRSVLAAHMGIKASNAFFSGFTDAIFNAPMLFFDSTPVGRILTRASSDLSILDFDIPFAIVFVFGAGIELLATIAIMASVTWPVLIVAVLAMVAINYTQTYYFSSARELIRINGTTKAPLMNYAAETSLGVMTIRAFRATNRFFGNFLKVVDEDAKLFFHSNAIMEWLNLRVEVFQNLILFTAALFLVLLPKGSTSPGLVGLSLSYAFSLTGTHIFLTRWYCQLSNYIISVERIKQFMNIPPEPPAIIEDRRPPSLWPSKGRIELEDLKIRYRPNAPLVLKGITCTFKEGNRVGVVGRTGSGKSTLISALFRLVETASGRILIDGLDIATIGLKDLRSKLSIIPQEPTLFRGTVRTNMDPLGLYSDEEIWQALEKCQLKAIISSLPNQLDSSVSDEGENWSAGQRQLFCLGRVLLKRNRILVLDEATASIDSATDAILQTVIRQEFAECTVITVAHRVPTVIDSDTVLVLSYGKMVEYGDPSKLLQMNSYFSKLVAEYWSSCRGNSRSS
ncbi:hypothetical protein MLD38_028933 [Melastoma candidum]|uniref:Uncharacterized protein n=1 Tax=Melastoma candidum TaxID=119954 RepID=A0ACB9N438_9MYRT|nr:hypothetical protein MLD38_028933 [Melastoma candidum]